MVEDGKGSQPGEGMETEGQCQAGQDCRRAERTGKEGSQAEEDRREGRGVSYPGVELRG